MGFLKRHRKIAISISVLFHVPKIAEFFIEEPIIPFLIKKLGGADMSSNEILKALPFVLIGIGLLLLFLIWREGNHMQLVLTPNKYAIGTSSMKGYPKEPSNAHWLHLEVIVKPISKPIDTLDLLIDSETIHANHWHGKNVAAFNVYFNITEWRWKGSRQVELIANVGNKIYSSGRIEIDFDVEPYGSHRI